MTSKSINLMPLQSLTSVNVPGLTTEYGLDEMECWFVNSDEFQTLDTSIRERWMATPLNELMQQAHEDKELQTACLMFCSYATDVIGISEGEEFCNDYGYLDTALAIAKALGVDDLMAVDADWELDLTEA